MIDKNYEFCVAGNNFFDLFQLPTLSCEEAEELLMSSVTQYSHSVSSTAAECVKDSVHKCTLPRYIKVSQTRALDIQRQK